MQSNKSALLLLASVEMEGTKQHTQGKFINGNFGTTTKKYE